MLTVIEYGKDEYDFPALLVLGCFDAIHVGHRDLIKKAKLQAKINGLDLGVMLFRDGKGDKLVYSYEERLAILEEFGVKFVLVIDFNSEFKATAPLDFLHAVEEKVNVKAYMSGKDFRFGAGAKGKSSTLKNYAEDEDNGVWYMPVKDVMQDGEKISTTLIKSYLENGDIMNANALLGSQFCVSGEVVKGAGRGASQLGYPTVNITYPENKCLVKQGVYTVKSTIGGTQYFGIANYGTCPTFGDDRVALEVHFDGFDGDLYGETLTIKFLGYLRDIAAFATPEELVAQLNTDKSVLADLAKQAEAEEAAAEKVPAPVAPASVKEEAVNEEAAPVVKEETAEEIEVNETVEPVEDEIAISANEYKELENGFDEIMDEPVEEVEETAETAPEETEETAEPEEETVTEEIEEIAEPLEEADEIEEGVNTVEEAEDLEKNQLEEEVFKVVEEVTEPMEEPQSEETEEAVETVNEEATEETVETFEPEEDNQLEHVEVIEGGFDEIVEEPSEDFDEAVETATEEVNEETTEETAEKTESVEETEAAEEIQPEDILSEEIEEVAEPVEEAELSEEEDGEENID